MGRVGWAVEMCRWVLLWGVLARKDVLGLSVWQALSKFKFLLPQSGMFVEVQRTERVSIPVNTEEIEASVFEALREKCAGVHTPESVQLFPTQIEKVSDVEVAEGRLYPLVEYRLVEYKVYSGEILFCAIEKQDSSGIYLTHPLISSVFVPAMQLPSPSEIKVVSRKGGKSLERWSWLYGDSVLYFQTGDMCKVKVLSSKQVPFLLCTMAEAGLGPCTWW
ncbi:DNA-directed RNA polymerase III subunit RPC8 [Nematocida sp. AWRm77]|nr:DNA-directed RNA polymerase III subunit RPC8 [Nematocida sp. AWRm77]